MTYLGDGGTSVGAFHEGINFAAVQKLPLVLVVEFNGWAYSTPFEKQCAAATLADKAVGYGIRGEVVDGNDAIAVYEVAQAAVDRARSGGGPTLLECKTYRMKGHAEHDAQAYVDAEELARWREQDPLARLAKALAESGVMSAADFRAAHEEIERELDADVAFAETSPFPDPSLAFGGVYADDAIIGARPRGRLHGGPLMADPRVARGGVTYTLTADGPGVEATYLDAVRQALFEEMERDERVFVLGEDVGVYGGAFKATEGLLERFGPARVLDTPLAEEAIVGAAIGAAMRGLRPVAEMQFMDFISRAFDLLTNFAAKNRYRTGDRRARSSSAGPSGAGVHGGPYHSQSPEMYFVKTPGLKVVAPATAADARALLKAAIRDDDPVIFLEHKFLYRRVRDRLVPGEDAGHAREGRRAPPGNRPHDRDVRRDALDRARGRPAPSRWTASRPRSSTCARSCRGTKRRS